MNDLFLNKLYLFCDKYHFAIHKYSFTFQLKENYISFYDLDNYITINIRMNEIEKCQFDLNQTIDFYKREFLISNFLHSDYKSMFIDLTNLFSFYFNNKLNLYFNNMSYDPFIFN